MPSRFILKKSSFKGNNKFKYEEPRRDLVYIVVLITVQNTPRRHQSKTRRRQYVQAGQQSAEDLLQPRSHEEKITNHSTDVHETPQ